jgi:signal transduction histidine kinase
LYYEIAGLRTEQVQKHRDVLLELAHSDKSDLDKPLRKICSLSAATLDVARVSYWSVEENNSAISCDTLYLRSTKSFYRELRANRLAFAEFPAYFEKLAAKRPIAANDALRHPATSDLAEGYLKPLGISSLLDAPVWKCGEGVGVLRHEHVGPARKWLAEEIDFVSALASMVSLALEESNRAQSEYLLRDSEGRLREIIEINREPHILGFGIDITERKQAEFELLRTLTREKELGRLRSYFVSMVSREFRTPLGIIQSSAEILEDYFEQLNPAERKSHLQSICNNTRRMAGLMEEALLIGSLDAGKFDFKPAPLELEIFVRRLMEEVLSATGQRCPIELLLRDVPVEIQGDERLLRHIFTNLLTNAVKYSDPGAVVRLEIGCSGTELICAIFDHGIGIPEADREWLFSAFHRGRNVEDRPGTGLGLVIAKRCIDLHGGKINVESKVGEGTVVTLWLPIGVRGSGFGVRGSGGLSRYWLSCDSGTSSMILLPKITR